MASNISGTNKIHIHARSYSAEDTPEENKNLFKSDYDVTAGPKSRSSWLKSIEKMRKSKDTIDDENDIKKVSLLSTPNTNWNHWTKFIGSTEEYGHYSDVLMKDDSFLDGYC